MATIFQVAEHYRKIDVRKTAEDIVLDNEQKILDYIREQQLGGKDGEGNKISPSYNSPYYAIRKNIMNNAPGFFTPDLYYSGEMHEKMYIDEDDFTPTSDVMYIQDLKEKYGKSFRLTPDSIKMILPWFIPEFKTRISNGM